MRIAALSDSALPSGNTRVGIWPSGLTLSRSAKAAFAAHDAVSTMRYGAPMRSSAIWVAADPEPCLPYKVYTVIPIAASGLRASAVAPAILMRGVMAPFGLDPQQIVVGIEA